MPESFVHIAAIIGFVISLITIGTVIFNIGKWSSRMERTERELHNVKNLFASYVPRELYNLEIAHVNRQLTELLTEIKSLSKMLVGIGFHKGEE